MLPKVAKGNMLRSVFWQDHLQAPLLFRWGLVAHCCRNVFAEACFAAGTGEGVGLKRRAQTIVCSSTPFKLLHVTGAQWESRSRQEFFPSVRRACNSTAPSNGLLLQLKPASQCGSLSTVSHKTAIVTIDATDSEGLIPTTHPTRHFYTRIV